MWIKDLAIYQEIWKT